MGYGEVGYNPIEYHNGTVWPHDNGLIAAGLRRSGHPDHATFFEWRLPEVFAGYPRSLTRFPVEYPTASSPQAWATGTPLLLLRVLLGLEPDGETLRSDPVLPTGIRELALRDIRGRWPKADVVAGR